MKDELTLTIRRPEGDFSYTWKGTPPITILMHYIWVFKKNTPRYVIKELERAVLEGYPVVFNYLYGETTEIYLLRLKAVSKDSTPEQIRMQYTKLDDSF